MSDQQQPGSDEEPVAKKLVTVDRLTRDRQRREEKAKGVLELPIKVNAQQLAFQLFVGYRILGFATIVCLIVGLMSLVIDDSDIPFLADFGFKPFAVCLIAYVWLKVVWTRIGLTVEANEAIKDIQEQVVELRCRD